MNKVVETYNYYVHGKNISSNENIDEKKEEEKDNLVQNDVHDNNYCRISINENGEIEHGHEESPIKLSPSKNNITDNIEDKNDNIENKNDLKDDTENKNDVENKDKNEIEDNIKNDQINFGNNLADLEVEYSDIHLKENILSGTTSKRLLFLTSITAAIALYGIIKKK
jgi:hypothetical protein